MKIMSVADIHLCHNNFEEVSNAFRQACRMCLSARCDILAIAGDVFDSYNPSGRHLDLASLLKLFIDPLIKVADQGVSVIVVPGNHDYDAKGRTMLEIYKDWHPYVYISLKPEVITCLERSDRSVGLDVSTMPWGFNIIKPGDIAIAHCHLKGIEMNGIPIESNQMVDPSIFDGFAYSSIGHIHNCKISSGKVHYTGGLTQLNFGEEGFDYGIEIYDTDTNKTTRFKPTGIPEYFTINELQLRELNDNVGLGNHNYKVRHHCDYMDLIEWHNDPRVTFEKITDAVSVKRTDNVYRASDNVLSLLRTYLSEKNLYTDELFAKCEAFIKENLNDTAA